MKRVTRHGTKIYILFPWGEIQIGTKYRSLTVWFNGKPYRIKRPKVAP